MRLRRFVLVSILLIIKNDDLAEWFDGNWNAVTMMIIISRTKMNAKFVLSSSSDVCVCVLFYKLLLHCGMSWQLICIYELNYCAKMSNCVDAPRCVRVRCNAIHSMVVDVSSLNSTKYRMYSRCWVFNLTIFVRIVRTFLGLRNTTWDWPTLFGQLNGVMCFCVDAGNKRNNRWDWAVMRRLLTLRGCQRT